MSEPIIPTTKAKPKPQNSKQQPATVELAVARPGGKVEIDDGLTFEVEALAQDAASEIARQIANEVKKKAKGVRILFLDGALAAAVSLHRTLQAQCNVLERAFKSVEYAAQEGITWLEREQQVVPKADMARDTNLRTTPGFESLSTPEAHLPGADSGLAAAANILSYFSVDETYSGRSASVSERALAFEIARHCSDNGLKFTWPSLDFVIRDLDRAPQFLPRLNEVAAAATDANFRIQQLSEMVDALDDENEWLGETQRRLDDAYKRYESAAAIFDQVQQTFLSEHQNEGLGPSELAHLGERVSQEAMGPDVYFLTAKVEKAGGSYRIRRHLWQAITLEPPLTFTAGSIVSFALLDGQGEFQTAGTTSHQSGFRAHRREWKTHDGQPLPQKTLRPFFLGVLVSVAAFVTLVALGALEAPELDVLSLILGAVAVFALWLSVRSLGE